MNTLKPQPPCPDCPECEKLASVSDESHKIGNFLDWIRMNGMEIVEHDEDGELNTYPLFIGNINKLLAKYYDIDLDKVEQERRALLEWLREIQA